MSIWHKQYTLEAIEARNNNSLPHHLGIKVIEIGDNFLRGSMPVDERTRQPLGILHGGASVVLAETLGSVASTLTLDDDHYCVGLEINANHISSVREGLVIGTVKPLHIGRSTQVWETIIRNNNNDKLVCISRLTAAILTRVG